MLHTHTKDTKQPKDNENKQTKSKTNKKKIRKNKQNKINKNKNKKQTNMLTSMKDKSSKYCIIEPVVGDRIYEDVSHNYLT